MPKAPRLRAREPIVALKRAGFSVERIRGSHHMLLHQDGRRTVVPVHTGETLGPGLLNKILRDVELTAEDLESLL